MQDYKLKISLYDWIYIIFIALLFGFLLSLLFYNLIEILKEIQTIIFCTLCALFIALFSTLFISISNKLLLPILTHKLWYSISFILSFLSGFIGFMFTFYLFKNSAIAIIEFIAPFYIQTAFFVGLLTFLIGLILHQFISMKYKQEHIQLQLVKTQLETLETELNPHFLFNALNSISELIYQNPKEAENAVIKLSHFLRNAITKKGLITIEEELNMVQTYVNIENIRFGNNIQLKIQNETEYKQQLIPKFSIQLLVENAIKHGYEGKPLYIIIDIQKSSITVSNSGKITSSLEFGVGLNNLQQRLKLLNIGQLEFNNDTMMHFTIQRYIQ